MFQRSATLTKSNSFFLFGARGVGKSTLIEHSFGPHESFTLNLLENELCARLQARPDDLIELVNRQKKQWCIIDEVQKVPELLDAVHLLIEKQRQKFVLTGSSARKLKRGSANLLAGRAFVFKLFPLTHVEIGQDFDLDSALSYGTLPKIFDLPLGRERNLYLKAYADTYLKEEILIEQLIRKLPPFRKFLELAAHQDTEMVSYSNIARDILVDPRIVTNYYTILEDTLLGFFLEPYHTAIRKRQSKSPKFYWFDCGVRRALSGHLDTPATPRSYEYGSLFESFIVNEFYRLLTYSEKSFSLSHLRIDDDIEVDLVLERPGMPTFLIEIKSTDRVHEAHGKGLRIIGDKLGHAKRILLSRDRVAKQIDGITCLHWKEGLREIGVC
jgi:predicted AAA+ superfamily ATPase